MKDSWPSVGSLRVYLKSHFAPAFYFLTPHRRQALKLLYAVCRVLDDTVDRGDPRAADVLAAWRRAIEQDVVEPLRPIGHEALGGQFLEMVRRFDIPRFALLDLIDKGVSRDLNPAPFETAMDAESYCYGVAGTVGIACLPIFGVPWQEGKDFAVRLGITVQWINMIRDVGVDAKMGRIYLPLEHLERFGYTQADLLAGVQNESLRQLMTFEASVARSNFRRASELLPPAWDKELLPAKVMGRIYFYLLEKIEKQRFPVMQRRVVLRLWEKAFATWKAMKD